MSNVNRTGAGFELRDNTVSDSHSRGLMLKASTGSVVNNTVARAFHGGIIVTPELAWGEADYSRDLRIESNLVHAVGYAKWSYGAIALGATEAQGQKGNGGGTVFATGGGHRRVAIVNNTVDACDTWAIWVSSTSGLTLVSNRIRWPWHHQTWADYTPPYPLPNNTVVFITETAGAYCHGNCILDPGPFVEAGFNSTGTAALVPGSQPPHSWLC